MKETHIYRVHRSNIVTILCNASDDIGIPNFESLFCAQIDEDHGHKVIGLLLGYDLIELEESMFIKYQNGLSYYCQPFHCPSPVNYLGLTWTLEYSDANQGLIPESHNVRV
jgi:hypothetical protein